jgi:hypothetical protein
VFALLDTPSERFWNATAMKRWELFELALPDDFPFAEIDALHTHVATTWTTGRSSRPSGGLGRRFERSRV